MLGELLRAQVKSSRPFLIGRAYSILGELLWAQVSSTPILIGSQSKELSLS